jgi:hypothetical protein
VTHSPQELAKALAAAERPVVPCWRPGGFITSVNQLQSLPPLGARRRRLPPGLPSVPVRDDVGANDAQGLAVVSKPADDVVAAPEVKRVGGVSVQLDIAVERRRSFWWRLVAKLQFFRS